MTIEKARRLLGKKYIGLSDEEVEKVISDLKIIAGNLVDKVVETIATFPKK